MARAKDIFQEHAERWAPDTGERKALSHHEPSVEFITVPSGGISEGRHSRVSILEYRVDDSPDRVLWKRMGQGKDLLREEAEELRSRLLPYRGDLAKYGWRIPEIFHTEVVGATGAEIFSYEELIGQGDAEHLLAHPTQPHFRKWFVIRKTLETLALYPKESIARQAVAGQELSVLPHGLDLKPANLVLEPDRNELYFVDLFGPKEIDHRTGRWRTYSPKLDTLPEENLMAVCATREGAILRFYRLAERLWAETAGIKSSALREEFLTMLRTTGLPGQETTFIAHELKNDFPWLNKLYSEQRI